MDAHALAGDAKKMLDEYILDYLKKEKLLKSAKAFQKERKIDTNVELIEAPEGFLFEWWSIFWDYFSVMIKNNQAPAASSYQEENARLQRKQLDMNRQFMHAQEQVQQQTCAPHAPNAILNSGTHQGCVGHPAWMLSRLSSQGRGTSKMGLPPLPPTHQSRLLGQGTPLNVPTNAKKRKSPSESDITGRKRRVIASRSTPAAMNSSIPAGAMNSSIPATKVQAWQQSTHDPGLASVATSIPVAQVQVRQQSCHDQGLASSANQKNDGDAPRMTDVIINNVKHNTNGNAIHIAHTMDSSNNKSPQDNRVASSLYDLVRGPAEHKTNGTISETAFTSDGSIKEIVSSDFSHGILLDNAGQSSLVHANTNFGAHVTQDNSDGQDGLDLLKISFNDDSFWDADIFTNFGQEDNCG